MLRIIPVARKPGKMPPFHDHMRGQGHDLRPTFLQADAGGTFVAVPHAPQAVATRPPRLLFHSPLILQQARLLKEEQRKSAHQYRWQFPPNALGRTLVGNLVEGSGEQIAERFKR
jgi:hypothetical protein